MLMTQRDTLSSASCTKTCNGWEQLLEATANRHHPVPIYRSTADGFDIDLPWSLADGREHSLVIETDRGIPLTGSPITLCVHPEGARALLQKTCNPSTADQPAQQLLDTLLQHQDNLAPRSAGFNVYPQWHATFLRPLPQQSCAGTVLVLLLGSGNEADASRSRQSLERQRLPGTQIRVLSIDATTASLPQQLAQHLADPDIACVVPLQRGDHLPEHALDTLLATLITYQADWGYADCDQDDAKGERSNPWLKPIWDETLFYGVDLITPGAIISAAALRRALQHLARHGAQLPPCWHSLLAGIIATTSRPVVHIPQVLYHRSASAAAAPHQALPDPSRHSALHWLANQRAPGAQVRNLTEFPALTRVLWPLPAQLPSVSLIIPTPRPS